MADLQTKNVYNVPDKRRGRGAATTDMSGTTHTNLKDITAMKARLTAINPTSYSAARLATMTVNDMIYAIRQNDEAASI